MDATGPAMTSRLTSAATDAGAPDGTGATAAGPPDRVDRAEIDDRGLRLRWGDGTEALFHALWLRDNAPEGRDPTNGQKLFDITDLPAGTTIAGADLLPDDRVAVLFGPDDHRSVFDGRWLRRHRYAPGPPDTGPERLWDRDLADRLPVLDHGTVMADAAALARWLAGYRDYGVARLTGGPVDPGTVLQVAAAIGHVRETNYGRLFDVRSEAQPINLAYTGLGLSVHTDNPYRDPVPGVQLLHCLANTAEGGESVVVDGFHAAALLRDDDPQAFYLLTRYEVPFEFRSQDAWLSARQRLIEKDDRGRVIAVRFNNRSIAPFDLPADAMERFYGAYRRFAEILIRPALHVTFRLKPGDTLMVNNQRVLHGRTPLGAGQRHLQGCYVDHDGPLSRLALLEAAQRQRQGRR